MGAKTDAIENQKIRDEKDNAISEININGNVRFYSNMLNIKGENRARIKQRKNKNNKKNKAIEKDVKKALNSKEIEELRQKDMYLYEKLKIYCKNKITGDLKRDLVLAAYIANECAHNRRIRDKWNDYYKDKELFLSYIMKEKLWGDPPYDSYGYKADDEGNAVLYFDVPPKDIEDSCSRDKRAGQVSFHIRNIEIDKSVPEYKYNWKNVKNTSFPSYERINNYHDLIMTLQFDCKKKIDYKIDERVILVQPKEINYRKLQKNQEKVCYFSDSKQSIEKIKKGKNNKKIKLRKVIFCKGKAEKSEIICSACELQNEEIKLK